MDSQFKNLIVFSHAAMIVFLMSSLLWASNSWYSVDPNTSITSQERNFLTHPTLNWPQP